MWITLFVNIGGGDNLCISPPLSHPPLAWGPTPPYRWGIPPPYLSECRKTPYNAVRKSKKIFG